jgi:hypothetical protein
VYASIRFDQPLGFVFSNLNKKLHTGEHSLWGRFGITLDLNEYLASLFCRPFDSQDLPGNYNLLNYALKSAIFGEFSYTEGIGFGVLAWVFANMGMAFLVIGAVWCVVLLWQQRANVDSVFVTKPPVSAKDLLFVGLLVASQVLSEMYFYIKMPYGCTMDFRYIMPLILGLALSIGIVGNTLAVAGGAWAKKCSMMLYIVAGGFIVSSTLFYCVCG